MIIIQLNLSIMTNFVFHNDDFSLFIKAFGVKRRTVVSSIGTSLHSVTLPGNWRSPGSVPECNEVVGRWSL